MKSVLPQRTYAAILADVNDTLHPFNEATLAGRFWAAPLELKMYALFATVVSILHCGLVFFGPKSLNEAIVPFTGWGASTGYLFTLYFAFALIFLKTLPRQTGIACRFGIIAILLLDIFISWKVWQRSGGYDFGNPYLRTSPLQPIWTMLIPAFWVMTLLSPRISKYCKFRAG